jgi:hypothetical protein
MDTPGDSLIRIMLIRRAMKNVLAREKLRIAVSLVRCLVVLIFLFSCVSAIYWLYDKPFLGISNSQYSPVMSALGIIFSATVWGAELLAGKAVRDKSTKPLLAEEHERYVRRELLNLVELIWIAGKLKQMLGGRLLIEVNKVERPDLIYHPWKVVLETAQTKQSYLPPDTQIIDIFSQGKGKLLILGEPGSGKTTIMLELARHAIERARHDVTLPLPFVFNLSTWSDEYENVSTWLISELTSSLYKVPKDLAGRLVENDQILLLLDGFDAVPNNKREACAKALNKFRQEHGLAQLVVCSRTADYTRLKTQLQMQGAVLLKPLTSHQIKAYLASMGSSSEGLADILKKNKPLAKLAETPLWLNLMTVIYYGMTADSIRDLIKTEYSGKQRTGDLVDAYVQRVLDGSRGTSAYTRSQTTRWLSWLAEHTSTDGLFFIDRMQPFLLEGYDFYYRAIIGLVMSLVSFHYLARNLPLMARVTGDQDFPNLMQPLLIIASVHVGLQSVALSMRGIRMVETWRWSWVKASQGLVRSLMMSSLIILFIWLSIEFRPIIERVILESLLYGILGSLLITGYAWFRYAIGIGWPWRGLWWPIIRLKEPIKVPLAVYIERILFRSLIAWGILVGLLPLLVVDFARHPHPEVLPNLLKAGEISIATLIFFIPLMIFLSGLRFYEFNKKIVPNQGIRLSTRNATRAYLFAISISVIVFMLMDRVATGSWPIAWMGDITINRPLQILSISSTMGVIAAMLFGGFACLQHYALRTALSMKRAIPWNYRKFLDFAADRTLLRKIGGGYEFIHENVRDYFETLSSS